MKITKQNFLILIILQMIICCLFVGCSNTGYKTYQNDQLHYAIDYPENWTIEAGEDASAVEPPVVITAPVPSFSRIAITVVEDSKLSPSQIAESLVSILTRRFPDFTVTVKEGKTERWDWRFAGYALMTEKDTIYVFGYYKQKANYLYKIDGMADSQIWDDLLIDKIISSFRLL